MKKLLIITTVPVTLKAFLLPYADHFRNLGWQVDCLSKGASRDTTCLAHFGNCFDIDWSRNPIAPSNMTKCPEQVRAIVEQEDYDIVHVHTPVAAFVTRFALRKLRKEIGTRVIYTAHGFHFHNGGNPLKNFLFQGIEEIASRWTDEIIVMNEEDFKAAKSFFPRVIKMNGIGLDLNYYSRSEISAENIALERSYLELNPEDKLFLMIAEFNPGKRHKDAIKALSILKARKFHIAFAGLGPLRNEMRILAEKLGVSDKVHFLGFREDVRALISASTATLMPSVREGLPRSVMESMALETPVIGADIRGTKDLLADGCGIIVPPLAPEAIAHAMAFCAYDLEEIKDIKVKAAEKIKDYSIEKLIEEHERIYDEQNFPA